MTRMRRRQSLSRQTIPEVVHLQIDQLSLSGFSRLEGLRVADSFRDSLDQALQEAQHLPLASRNTPYASQPMKGHDTSVLPEDLGAHLARLVVGRVMS